MIGEFISEVIGQIFIEIIFNKIIVPTCRFTGALTRWFFCFFQTPLSEIQKKDHNGILGLFKIILVVTAILVITQR